MNQDRILNYIDYLKKMDQQDKTINQRMGLYLQQLISNKKITRRQITKKLFLSLEEWLSYETGGKALTLIQLYKLSELCGIPLLEFIHKGIQKKR